MVDLRTKIANVVGEELPWLEHDLLELADKIIKVIPKLDEKEVGEVLNCLPVLSYVGDKECIEKSVIVKAICSYFSKPKE